MKLCSVVFMCALLCVREREGEGGVCVLRYKIKYVFFSVDHNQPVLKVTDLEHTNGAKQRAIASGFPGERCSPVWLAGVDFQRMFGNRKWALEEDKVQM